MVNINRGGWMMLELFVGFCAQSGSIAEGNSIDEIERLQLAMEQS